MKVIVLKGDQIIDGAFYRDGTVLEVTDSFSDKLIKHVIKEEPNGSTE